MRRRICSVSVRLCFTADIFYFTIDLMLLSLAGDHRIELT